MDGEIYALMDEFDATYIIKRALALMFDTHLDLNLFTDSEKVLDAVTRLKRMSERRLSIYVTAARQSYRNFEISCIGLIKGIMNPGDELTKVYGNISLSRTMETSVDQTKVEQRIIRDEEKSTGGEKQGRSLKDTTGKVGIVESTELGM